MLPFPSPASLCTSESRIQRFFSQNRTSSPLGPFCHQRTSSRTCFCVFRRTCPHERTTLVSTIVSQQMLSDIRGYDVQRQASQSSLVALRKWGADSKHPLPPPLARRNPGIPKARSKRMSSFVHPALTLRRKGASSFRPPAPRAGRSGCSGHSAVSSVLAAEGGTGLCDPGQAPQRARASAAASAKRGADSLPDEGMRGSPTEDLVS